MMRAHNACGDKPVIEAMVFEKEEAGEQATSNDRDRHCTNYATKHNRATTQRSRVTIVWCGPAISDDGRREQTSSRLMGRVHGEDHHVSSSKSVVFARTSTAIGVEVGDLNDMTKICHNRAVLCEQGKLREQHTVSDYIGAFANQSRDSVRWSKYCFWRLPRLRNRSSQICTSVPRLWGWGCFTSRYIFGQEWAPVCIIIFGRDWVWM